MKKYESAIIAPRRQARPGMIRHALAGAALGLFAMAMIRPFCQWMVWSGTILEGWLK